MIGPIIAIVRSAFHAGQYVERKRLVTSGIDPIIVQFLVRLPLIIVAFTALILGYQLNIANINFWYNVIPSAFIVWISTIFVNISLKEDLSLVGPLMAFGPLIVMIVGIFYLGEIPSKIGFIGVLLIVIGTYFSHFDKKNIKNTQPFVELINNKGVRLTFLALIFFSVSNGLTKAAINASDVWTTLIVFCITFSILSFLGVVVMIKPKNIMW